MTVIGSLEKGRSTSSGGVRRHLVRPLPVDLSGYGIDCSGFDLFSLSICSAFVLLFRVVCVWLPWKKALKRTEKKGMLYAEEPARTQRYIDFYFLKTVNCF